MPHLPGDVGTPTAPEIAFPLVGKETGSKSPSTPRPRALESARPITILLVDRAALFRLGMRESLQAASPPIVFAEASDLEAACARGREISPDVILLDAELNPGRWKQNLTALRAAAPHARLVALVTAANDPWAPRFVGAGAAGCINRNVASDALIVLLRDFASGKAAPAAERTGPRLSAQQLEIMEHLVRGATNGQIAARMGLQTYTVRNYLTRIFAKFRVSRRAAAVTAYLQLCIEDRALN